MGRVIIDSGLHTGRMAYDDALQLETDRIGFVRQGGQINIDSITAGGADTAAPDARATSSGCCCARTTTRRCANSIRSGSLKDFHDRVYKIGFLPVRLVRETMFHQLEQEFRKPATARPG